MADYNEMTIKEMYDLTQTIAAELFEGKTYPWEVLPEIGDFIVKLGATLDPNEYEKKGENVWIAKSAKVAPTASITGPCIIGKDTEVRQCAFIRGKASTYSLSLGYRYGSAGVGYSCIRHHTCRLLLWCSTLCKMPFPGRNRRGL